jgi:peptide deformylase
MAKLVPEAHHALHEIAEEVPEELIGSPRIKKVLKDMRAALLSYKSEGFVGVAIAAPQIGVSLRIFLVEDMSPDRDKSAALPTLVAINPKIIKLSKKKKILGEGCLSVRDRYGKVERAERATLRALDENGTEYERGASGLLAQIFQHEVDHLDGILFVDHAKELINKKEEKPASKEVKRSAKK